MKNRYIILSISALFALFSTSCNKFLDEMPDNRTELDNEEKIRKLLVSAYPDNTYALFTELMSDNYDDVGTVESSSRDLEQAYYWMDDTEEANDSPKNTWSSFYLAIAHANQALQAIAELGNPERLDPLRGEALMARAWAHFKLVNVFCQHYSETYSATDLGIPYMESSETEVNPMYERGTVKEVYEKIARDIEEGLPLIDDTIYDVPKYHFNRLAAYGFASEFYLYYKKYDKCIEYADVVLGTNPEMMMRDVSGLKSLPYPDPQYRAYIAPNVNTNLLMMTNYSSVGAFASYYTTGKRFMHTEDLAKREGICAPHVLWTAETGSSGQNYFLYPPMGWITGSGKVFYARFTVPYLFEYTDPVAGIGFIHSVSIMVNADNALMCRIEANIMKENYAAAMEDINLWVKKRIVATHNSPKTEAQVDEYIESLPYHTAKRASIRKTMSPPDGNFASSKQENFIQTLMLMRRIEFHGEGTRWFDIKRYGIQVIHRDIAINSRYSAPETETVSVNSSVVLESRDERMAIQIPIGVLTAGLEGNPRTKKY